MGAGWAVAACALIAACGGSDPGSADPPATTASATSTSSSAVEIVIRTTGRNRTTSTLEQPVVAEAAPTTAPVAVPDIAPPDPAAPPVVARPVPAETVTPPFSFVSPWASVTASTSWGGTSVALGCAAGTDAGSLDRFFADRLGPLLGEDYQSVYPLGGDRHLWLFQDAFVDHTGLATRLDEAAFVHNLAMVQQGACFTMYHGGTINRPTSFERGVGERSLTRWFWPKGGELTAAGLQVFWVEMVKDPYEPGLGDGLGWHPEATWLATYDPVTLARRSFEPAPNPGAVPVYGYAVASDGQHTYLFGNTFEQNLVREGGWASGPHSATAMYLARVPLGDLGALPEYRTADGWSSDPATAVAISQRYWVENPMQPRFLDGVWVAATKVDGYWGERLAIDVATHPWGPWENVRTIGISPRNADPLMNTYHAHLLPWRDQRGDLVVSISQNARDMVAHAFPAPSRYRPSVFTSSWAVPTPPPTTTTTTTAAPTTTTVVEPVPSTEPPTTPPTDTTTTTTTAAPTTTAPATTTSAPATPVTGLGVTTSTTGTTATTATSPPTVGSSSP